MREGKRLLWEKGLKTYHAVFTTKRLALIACFLTGYLLMQAIWSYYDFN